MVRVLALVLGVVLSAQAAPAFAQSVNVFGKLDNGNFVNAVVSKGANGQFSGTGVLYGVNPSNGYRYQYPFSINRLATAPGQVILTGNMIGAGFPVTLTATVPNGPLTFSYVVNGKTYTMAGTGSVTIK